MCSKTEQVLKQNKLRVYCLGALLYSGLASADFGLSGVNVGDDLDNTISIVYGDLDGDGDLDLIAGNSDMTNKLYMNDGNGNFSASGINVGIESDRTNALALGDVDGDGYLDLIAGNYGSSGSNNGTYNKLYLNNGSGSFSSFGIRISSDTDRTKSLALGDVNGDGLLDLISGNMESNKLYINEGDGDFINGVVVGGAGKDVMLGDVNGDGALDLIDGGGKGQVTIYLNNNNGGFSTTGITVSTEREVYALEDMDNDGDLDLIINESQTVKKLFINDGSGHFSWDGTTVGIDTGYFSSLAIGDVDGDAHKDVVIGKRGESNMLYLSDGNGGFDANGIILGSETDSTQDTKLLDVDGDGDLDLFVGNYGQANKLYLNDLVIGNHTGDVFISGTATQGEVLIASHDLSDPNGLGVIDYQWIRDSTDIIGAVNNNYTLVEADVGSIISVRASYIDGAGGFESASDTLSSAITNLNDSPTGRVTVSGVAREGQTLTARNTLADVDGLGSIRYQWLRNGSALGGETSNRYRLVEADVGHRLSVSASYIDGHGTAESISSVLTAEVANVNDLPTGEVSISGRPLEGQILTASNTIGDHDGLGAITYTWKRGSEDIATGSSYLLVATDVDHNLLVEATYTDGHGTNEMVTSLATDIIVGDHDGDGIGNDVDTDDDNDGVQDTDDAFPLDNTESVDTDGDGIGNNADTDDDNDGVTDSDDAFPLDNTESIDTDGDGIGNNADTDDDNDGVADTDDAFPLDDTETLDSDGDGIGDNADETPYPPSGELSLESTSYSVAENETSIDIQVVRRGGDYGELLVDFSLKDESAYATSDYEFKTGTLTFLDGEVNQTITLNIVNDDVFESDETFILSLNHFHGVGTLGLDSTAVITIIDDEVAPNAGVIGFTSISAWAHENDGSVNVEVARVKGSDGDVTISYSLSDGSAIAGNDYITDSGLLTFFDGEISKSINVVLVDNDVYENDETFSLRLSNPQGGAKLDVDQQTITIVDDETIPNSGAIEFEFADYSVNESETTVNVKVTRVGGSVGEVSIDVNSIDVTATSELDYQSLTQTLTFEDGETEQHISLNISDDDVFEGDERFELSLSNAVGTMPGTQSSALIKIIENEEAPPGGVIQFSGGTYITNENSGTISVTLIRTQGSQGDTSVEVNINYDEATNVQKSNQIEAVSFIDGETSKTVNVVIEDNTNYTGDITFSLTLANLTGDASIGFQSSSMIIVKEDEPVPPSGILQLSGDSYTFNEGDGTVVVTVTRSDGSYGEVSVDYLVSDDSAVDGEDYLATEGTLYFADGEMSQTISIDVLEDSVDENIESFTVTLSNPVNTILGSIKNASVSIVDNDKVVVVEPPASNGGGSMNILWLFGVVLFSSRRKNIFKG